MDYSKHENYSFEKLINNIYFYGYMASLTCVLTSLIVIIHLKNLPLRIKSLHIQLLVTVFVDNVIWLISHKLMTEHPWILDENPRWCQFLHLVSIYTMLSTYFFLFLEGISMFLTVFAVHLDEAKLKKWFFVAGWIVPLLIDGVYAIQRYNHGDTSRCWMEIEKTLSVLTFTVCTLLFASLVILVSVVCTILKSHFDNPRMKFFKTIHAIFSLLPLFGLQYISKLFDLVPGSDLEKTLEMIIAILTSTQGVMVSVLYCFANCEVAAAILEEYRQRRNNAPADEPIPMADLPAEPEEEISIYIEE